MDRLEKKCQQEDVKFIKIPRGVSHQPKNSANAKKTKKTSKQKKKKKRRGRTAHIVIHIMIVT